MKTPITSQITFLPCADLERAEYFYKEILGCSLVLDQGKCRIYSVSGGSYIGLCRREKPFSSEGCILTLVTADVDGWAKEIEDKGWPIDVGPRDNQVFQIRQCFLRDPDGHVIEIQRFLHPFP